METEKLILIYTSKYNTLDELSEADKTYVDSYFDKYLDNPRLSDEQDSKYTKLLLLETYYDIYISSKDSKKKKNVKAPNEAIQNFFSTLKDIQET